MTLFPLDAVRNASIDESVEIQLEEVRGQVAAFDFSSGESIDCEEALAVFDAARPRLNVLAFLLAPLRGVRGADISTGVGFLPVLLQRRGLEMEATERNCKLANFAGSHGIDVQAYEIGRTPPPFEPGSLDFIVCAEVLEHLRSAPAAVIRELAMILRPGGRLLLTTPNIARLRHLELLASGESFHEPYPADLSSDVDAIVFVEHVREYSIREMVDAVEYSGLGVERVLMTGWGEAGYHPLPNPYSNEIMVIEAHK